MPEFNTENPMIMHIDINSAFASAEQQACEAEDTTGETEYLNLLLKRV